MTFEPEVYYAKCFECPGAGVRVAVMLL